jgi:hypothetical protein
MKNETCMQVDSPYSDQVEWAVAPVTTTVATATVATAITAVEEAAAVTTVEEAVAVTVTIILVEAVGVVAPKPTAPEVTDQLT